MDVWIFPLNEASAEQLPGLRTRNLCPMLKRFPGHIALLIVNTIRNCVVPILTSDGQVVAVLDVDSNDPDAVWRN